MLFFTGLRILLFCTCSEICVRLSPNSVLPLSTCVCDGRSPLWMVTCWLSVAVTHLSSAYWNRVPEWTKNRQPFFLKAGSVGFGSPLNTCVACVLLWIAGLQPHLAWVRLIRLWGRGWGCTPVVHEPSRHPGLTSYQHTHSAAWNTGETHDWSWIMMGGGGFQFCLHSSPWLFWHSWNLKKTRAYFTQLLQNLKKKKNSQTHFTLTVGRKWIRDVFCLESPEEEWCCANPGPIKYEYEYTSKI